MRALMEVVSPPRLGSGTGRLRHDRHGSGTRGSRAHLPDRRRGRERSLAGLGELDFATGARARGKKAGGTGPREAPCRGADPDDPRDPGRHRAQRVQRRLSRTARGEKARAPCARRKLHGGVSRVRGRGGRRSTSACRSFPRAPRRRTSPSHSSAGSGSLPRTGAAGYT